jgi:uncharacterized protein YjiS (DUF1127 family)
MASVTTDITSAPRSQDTFSDKLVRVLERMARLSSTYRQVDALNRISDAELAAKGLTRQAAAERIFGSRLYS